MSNQILVFGGITIYTTIQVAAVILVGLAAGLFYSWDCAIVGGLGNLPDDQFLTAFQSINRVILNPYFFMSFICIKIFSFVHIRILVST